MIIPLNKSQELRMMARRLEELANATEDGERFDQAGRGQGNARKEPLDSVRLLAVATAIYQARRMRARFFGEDLFGEPAWDILLDLFICHLRRKVISTTSLCIAASVPQTTALRWIQLLDKEGLVRREPSPLDARVNCQSLTPKGAKLMREYVEAQYEAFKAATERGSLMMAG